MMWMHNGTFSRAVEEYTGDEVLELEVFPDPNVPGAYAVRALVKPRPSGNAYTVEFLATSERVQDITADTLEEVEFTTWPPSVEGSN